MEFQNITKTQLYLISQFWKFAGMQGWPEDSAGCRSFQYIWMSWEVTLERRRMKERRSAPISETMTPTATGPCRATCRALALAWRTEDRSAGHRDTGGISREGHKGTMVGSLPHFTEPWSCFTDIHNTCLFPSYWARKLLLPTTVRVTATYRLLSLNFCLKDLLLT